MRDEMYERMNETESYHWWFRAKRDIVLTLAQPFLLTDMTDKKLPDSRLELADFGCGCGHMLSELKKYGNTTGYDFSELALSYCKKKCNVKLKQLDLGDKQFTPEETYDVVFALDIIEHIKDDKTAMENIYKAVKHKGHAIITVPAFPWLWSQNDINNGHQRRYNMKQLCNLVESVGFKIEYASYYNCYLFLPAAVVRIITRIFHMDKHSDIEYDSGNSIFNSLFYNIFASEKKRVKKHKHFPFGLSLIILLSKETNYE